jgi:hypothetical protein
MATWKKLAYLDEVATLSDVTPQAVGTTASAGTGIAASREDHVHVLGDGAVSTAAKLAADVVETAKIKDANVTAAKLATDSVETLKIKDLNVTTAKLAADAVDGTKIADDAVGSEHIKPLSAALEVNGQQLQDAVIHQAATPPTAIKGKPYYDTDDDHVYVCTSEA